MKIVWDLDGVLRDLNGYLVHLYGGRYPTEWKFTYGNGKSIYECINNNLSILTKAPPTAYLNVLLNHYRYPEIWTSQAKKWQARTTRWIVNHLGSKCDIHFLKCEEKEARLREEEDTLLIEDSPNFKSYDRILLLDRPYNQEVKGAVRIYGTKHLNNIIELTKN